MEYSKMKNKKIDIGNIKNIVYKIIIALNIVIFLFFIFCDQTIHYSNKGKIIAVIPYDTVYATINMPGKHKIDKIYYEYHYIDNDTHEELIQTSEDIENHSYWHDEDMIRKHNRKYFYEYRDLTDPILYLVSTLILACVFYISKITKSLHKLYK